MDKNINTQQALFFSFLKGQSLKNKKIINISCLIMVLMKMSLLLIRFIL